jgi:argininosuccinate lyase
MTLWGGRFREAPERVLWDYSVDPADRRLLRHDVEGSIAHATMLGEVGLLSPEDTEAIVAGLRGILDEDKAGTFVFLDGDEDVHSAVERRLTELVGPAAGKLHTGRSRNDQIALDERLYLREAATQRVDQLAAFVLHLAGLAEGHSETVVPAYTHLQQSQPVSFGHHLLAYAWMMLRDRERFLALGPRLSLSPLGAGAGGGSSLPLDPARTAELLGMAAPLPNSLDAVASRDLVSEYVFCCAQAMTHLSRLAEELVLWSTAEFGWMTPADRHATGSSALPQKKNPDIAELARGRTARVIGDLVTILTLQKGTPLSYNRDFQEDKPPLFRANDTLATTIDALSALLAGARFHPAAPGAWTTALDLAETLVSRGVAFREAHAAVGRLVAALLERGDTMANANAADLQAAHPLLTTSDLAVLDPATSPHRRRSPGGGSPGSVADQVAALRRMLASD